MYVTFKPCLKVIFLFTYYVVNVYMYIACFRIIFLFTEKLQYKPIELSTYISFITDYFAKYDLMTQQ